MCPVGKGFAHNAEKMDRQVLPLSCLQCRERKLKCDRISPSCSRCLRFGDTCDYPQERRKTTGKRKQVRELEAKLVELESQLNAARFGGLTWPVNNNDDLTGSSMIDTSPETDFQIHFDGLLPADEPIVPNDCPAKEHLEPSVSQNGSSHIARKLSAAYFERQDHCAPMIHPTRYMESLSLPPDSQPPLCLQCIIMAFGAQVSEGFGSLCVPLYERARAYAKADESSAEESISLAHVQCWDLIANFEAQQGTISKASASFCQSTRIAQLLELHQLEKVCGASVWDTIEWEERCRTWWVVFISDRIMCATTGLPTVIHSEDVETLLPVSDKAFMEGLEEDSTTLQGALTEKSVKLSQLASRVLIAHLVQQVMELTSKSHQMKDFSKEQVDAYWKRHRELDNELSLLTLRLPDNLGSHQYARSQSAIAVNAQIQTAIMALHRAKAWLLRNSQNGDDSQSSLQNMRHSQERVLAGAEEIAHILRMTKDIKTTFKNIVLSFAVYLSCVVLVEDFLENDRLQSRDTACFLSCLLASVGEKNAVAESLSHQMENIMTEVGIKTPERAHSKADSNDIFSSKSGPLLANVAFRLVRGGNLSSS